MIQKNISKIEFRHKVRLSSEKQHKNQRALKTLTLAGRTKGKNFIGSRENNPLFMAIEHNRKTLHNSQKHTKMLQNTSMVKARQEKRNFHRIVNGQKKLIKEEKEKWMKNNLTLFPHILKTTFDIEQRHFYRYKQNKDCNIERFYLEEESNLCYNDTFSTGRISGSMAYSPCTKNSQIILAGGINPQMSTKLLLHQYDDSQKQWNDLSVEGTNQPRFNISHHATILYKGVLYFVGGIAVIPSHDKDFNDRYSIPFIPTFSLKTRKWDRINWGVYLRAHACTMLGSHIIIHGGITEEEKYSDRVYVMDTQIKSCPVSINSKSEKDMMCLAYHRIVCTQKIQSKIQEELKVKGLLCFGGKNGKNQVNKELIFYNCQNKTLWDNDDITNKWTSLQTYGKKPEGRFGHSMDILNTRTSYVNLQAFCVVMGGINEKEQVLKDVWILDLLNMNWIDVEIINGSSRLSNGLAFHCTTTDLNKVYVLGGYDRTLKCCTGLWSLNYEKHLGITDKKDKKMNTRRQ